MNCPRDNALLLSSQKGELSINSCPLCFGFSVLLGQDAAHNLEAQLRRAISLDDPRVPVEVLKSPYNGQEMKRFTYRGVQLDYCPVTHSIWFDRGEYSRMFQSPTHSSEPPTKRSLEPAPEGRSTTERVFDTVDGTATFLSFASELVEALVSGVSFFDF